jgi:hypothetical protein
MTAMPPGFEFHNGSCAPCDTAEGPCCCGAWHSLSEWPKEVRDAVRHEWYSSKPPQRPKWVWRLFRKFWGQENCL